MSWNDPILRSTFSFLFSTFYSRKHEKVTIRKVMVGSWQRRNFLPIFSLFFIRKKQKKAKLLINISIVKIVCKCTTLHIVFAKKTMHKLCIFRKKNLNDLFTDYILQLVSLWKDAEVLFVLVKIHTHMFSSFLCEILIRIENITFYLCKSSS